MDEQFWKAMYIILFLIWFGIRDHVHCLSEDLPYNCLDYFFTEYIS
jgi:hypothetical protein